jgi:ribosomal-protein-alanine N-acetyltransferase
MNIDWERIPTITGKRISLRPLTDKDESSLYSIYSDPEVMRYWGSTPMKSPTDAASFLAEVRSDLRDRSCIQWGIARRDNDQVIGTVAFFHVDDFAGKAELGFALGRPYWGNGYMREALEAVLNYAFCEMKLRRMEADVDQRNLPSVRLLERLGFQMEGCLRERWLVAGETQDALFYGLLSKEWKSIDSVYDVKVPPLPKHINLPVRSWIAGSRMRRWAALVLGMISSG